MKRINRVDRELAQNAIPVKSIWFRGRLNKPLALSCHHSAECHFIKQGRGSYLISGTVYPFQDNSFILILPGEVHALIPRATETLEKCALMFDESLAGHDFKQIKKQIRHSHVRHLAVPESDAARFEAIFRHISDEISSRDIGWTWVAKAKLMELAILIKRLLTHPPLKIQQNSIVTRLIGHLEGHYTQALKVEDLARHFGYSYSYLSRIFTKHVGYGIKQFIIQHKVLQAKRLLEEEPELKITAIAEKSGFNDFASFSEYFKSIVKMTPGAYRKKAYLESKKAYIQRTCNIK